ncbi:MAG: hypothetical protein EAZ99_13600 [Alphaproteobacteria bacterium]|nr:peptidylprolyl isomerase [Alphaproteobacteria bacterium]TAD88434.1 MAG: hypothetical protein EAZ99_13600 [Alphaproteobacteria bacterium]
MVAAVMRALVRSLAAAGCAAGLALATPVLAQSELRIVAVVNDEVITQYDLGARIGLVLLASREQPTPQVMQRVLRPVVRQLIDERLQLQEAASRGITASPAEVQEALNDLAQANGVSAEQLVQVLARANVPIETLRAQLRARVAWQRLVVRRLQATRSVTPEDIDEELAELRRNVGQPEYLLAEIQINVDGAEGEAQARQTLANIIGRLQAGEPFPALARQFSESSTAPAGGDLGWSRESQIESEILTALRSMRPGQVSQPIRTPSGFVLVAYREQRRIQPPEAGAVVVALRQVLIPATPQTAEEALAAARQIQAQARSCDDLGAAVARRGAPPPVDSPATPITALAPALAEPAANTPVGQAFGPFRAEGGIALMMVCQRTSTGDAQLRDAIRQRLTIERVDVLARRYLRDLRQSAFIDVRL